MLSPMPTADNAFTPNELQSLMAGERAISHDLRMTRSSESI
jgi:hypothetical protein